MIQDRSVGCGDFPTLPVSLSLRCLSIVDVLAIYSLTDSVTYSPLITPTIANDNHEQDLTRQQHPGSHMSICDVPCL